MKKLEHQLTSTCFMLTIIALVFFASLVIVSLVSRRSALETKEAFMNPLELYRIRLSSSTRIRGGPWDRMGEDIQKKVVFRAGSGGAGISGGYGLGSYELVAVRPPEAPPSPFVVPPPSPASDTAGGGGTPVQCPAPAAAIIIGA